MKPIMFSGGIGSIEENHTQKLSPEKGRFLYTLYISYLWFINVNIFKCVNPDTLVFTKEVNHSKYKCFLLKVN